MLKNRLRQSPYFKRALAGYLFISPFLVGLIVLFLGMLIQTFQFSRSVIAIGPAGFTLAPVNWANYNRLFFVDAYIRVELITSVAGMIPETLLIIIFSFFAANLLNQNFRGRFLARAIMFLPIILTSGVILAMEINDTMLNLLSDTDVQSTALDGDGLRLLASVTNLIGGIRFEFNNFVINPSEWIVLAIDGIYDIIIASGVQILVFLAGLQSIPPSLYEASTVEGATRWENFWKITFPMVSPLILVNVVYSVIDSFTKPTNTVMQTINRLAFNNLDFGGSAALSVSYFLLVILMLGIVVGLISRKVFYYD